MRDKTNKPIESTQSIKDELKSIAKLLDEIDLDCAQADKNSIPLLSHIIKESTTVKKTDNTMVTQSLFPTDDEMSEQEIPTLTQSIKKTNPKSDEEQLVLPPVEELDAELAQSQPTIQAQIEPTQKWIDQTVKQCLKELEPIVREKISKMLANRK